MARVDSSKPYARLIEARQLAVRELLESNELCLTEATEALASLPDLERNICSVYSRRVRRERHGQTETSPSGSCASPHANMLCFSRRRRSWLRR